MSRRQPQEATLAFVRAGLHAAQQRRLAEATTKPAIPFVTISRQAGARGNTFAQRLADRQGRDPGPPPWTAWDRELVEKVGAEQGIPSGWSNRSRRRDDRGSNSSSPGSPMGTRRATWTSRWCTAAWPAPSGGWPGRESRSSSVPVACTRRRTCVRLLAPFEQRVAHLAEVRDVPAPQAAAEVRRLDYDRDAFHRRHCRGNTPLPEIFTITLNVAAMSDELMVACVLPLIPFRGSSARVSDSARQEFEHV